MIRVQALSKNFSNIQAVDQVSFDASRGEVLGFPFKLDLSMRCIIQEKKTRTKKEVLRGGKRS